MADIPNVASTSGPAMAAALNDNLDGWNRSMGLRFVSATTDEVVAELDIGPEHRQPYGIVHGGVYAGVIETVTSVGAALVAATRQQTSVGLENHTSFLHATREGRLRVVARPLQRGRRTQVWEGTVTDERGVVAATGRVRLMSLDPGASLAGETAALQPGMRPA
jgi:1,4-dihydroxy-2-naphthoyl-CoA hydrolase